MEVLFNCLTGARSPQGGMHAQKPFFQRKLPIVIAIVAAAVGAFAAGPRVRLDPQKPDLHWPDDLSAVESNLAAGESKFTDLVPNTEKRITWFGGQRKRTPVSIVYIHGFGASRQEIAPVQHKVAAALKANLFETRLSGHGRGLALGDTKAQEWINDSWEAYEIGRRIGDKVIIVAMSTGAPLALYLADQDQGRNIAGMALLSANFYPYDPKARILLLPWGLGLAKMIQGKDYEWTPRNKEMGIYWTTKHKVDTLLEVMALVDYSAQIDLARMKIPTIMIYTKKDTVVSPAHIEAAYARLGSPRKQLIDLPGATMHNIASNIVAPENVDEVSGLIARFMLGE